MTLRRWLGIAALAAALAAGGQAQARLIDFRAGARAGGVVGWGSVANTPDFFDETRGAGLGFELGAKLLIFDFSASFLQVLNGGGTVGTLTQFLAGLDFDIPVGQAKLSDGKTANVLRPGAGAGFGFGTPGPVDPPLDAAQVSDKGLIVRSKIAFEHFLNPFIGVGVEGSFGYHYFLGGEAVNNVQDHSSGYHLIGLGTFTFHLGY